MSDEKKPQFSTQELEDAKKIGSDIKNLSDEQIKNLKEVLAAYRLQREELKLVRDVYKELNFSSEKMVSYSETLTKDLENQRKLASEFAGLVKKNNLDRIQIEKEINALKGKDDEASKNRLEVLKNALETSEGLSDSLTKQSEEILRKIEYTERQLEEEDKINRAITARRNLHRDIGASMRDHLASSLGLGDLMGNINNKMGLMASITMRIAENTKKLFTDVLEGNQQFAKATGQIADRTLTFGSAMSQYGIGFAELNKASISLFTSMSNFSNLNKGIQEDLAKNAAKMELLGVSADITGKNFDVLTKGIKLNSEEAIKVNDDLAKAAIGAGIAPSKMLSEFGPAMSKLSAYGKDGIKVFTDMEKAAKSLGMEMSSLNSVIGDQFDTFEGSAQAAGKLNAVLGGNYLNSIEMLNATESERILMLKRSFDASGKNFDQLDKYEKKAIAATLGITDLNEASKLFGTSTSQLTSDMAKQAATQEELQKVQQEAAQVQAQINQLFNGFLVLIGPIVNIVKGLVNAITELNDATGGSISYIMAFVAGIYLLSKAGGAVTAMKDLWNWTKSVGTAMVDGAKKIGEFVTGANRIRPPGGGPGGGPTPPIPPTDGLRAAQENVARAGETKTGGFVAFMKALRDGIQAFFENPGKTLGGAAVLAGAMFILAVGLGASGWVLNKFSDVKTVMGFAASLVLIAIALKTVSGITTGDMIAKAAILTAAMVLAAVGLYAMGKVFEIFTGIDYGKVMQGVIATGLIMLAVIGLGALMSGPAIAFLIAGVAAMVILAVGLLALGAALIVFGAGVEAVFGPLSKFADQIDSILKISAAIGILAASFAILAIMGSNPIFMIGFAVGAAAITTTVLGLSAAVNTISLDKMTGLIKLIEMLKESLSFDVKINIPANMITDINAALSKVEQEKALAFSGSMQALNETIKLTGEAPERLEKTTTFFNTVKEYYTAQAASKDSDKDALVAALKELKEVMNPFGGGAGGKKEIPVVLRIGNAKDIRAALEMKVGEQNQ